MVRTAPRIAALVLTVLGGEACAPARAAEDVEHGRTLATQLCARCHMVPGQGEKVGPDGIPGFAAVAKRPQQTMDGIVHWLRSIPPMMPNHHLTQDEMHDIAAFIVSLKEQP